MTIDELAAQVERCWLDHGNEDEAHDCGHDNFQDCIGAVWKALRTTIPTFSEREAIRLLVAAKLRKESGREDAEYRRLKDEGWRIAFEVDKRRKAALAARPIANAGDLLEELVAQGAASINARIDQVVLAGIAAAEKEDAAAAGKARDVTPIVGAMVRHAVRTEARASAALDGDTQCCHDWSAGPACRMCKKPQAGTDPGEACPGTPVERTSFSGLRFCTNDYCGGHTRAPWACTGG